MLHGDAMVGEQRPQAAGRKAHGGEGAREALRGIQCVGHNIIVCRSARYAWVRVRFAFRLKGGECPVAGRHAQCEAGGRWEGSDEAAGVEVAGRRWSREKPRWRRSAKPSLAHRCNVYRPKQSGVISSFAALRRP